MFRTSLVLLLFGALLTSVSVKNPGWKNFSPVLSAVLLGFSLITSTALKIRAPEKTWFGGRAVAESVKSLTWKFMAGGAPFGMDLSRSDAVTKFGGELQAILKERRSLAAKFSDPADALQITEEMKANRNKSAQERLTLYLEERVNDQRKWYASKAGIARSSNDNWFWVTTAGQFAALAGAVWVVYAPDSPIRFTGFFSAVASAAMAWLQMKRYQDVSQSYAMAAHELGLIELQAQNVRDQIAGAAAPTDAEAHLASFVANAENAMSREHTMWVARRDVG